MQTKSRSDSCDSRCSPAAATSSLCLITRQRSSLSPDSAPSPNNQQPPLCHSRAQPKHERSLSNHFRTQNMLIFTFSLINAKEEEVIDSIKTSAQQLVPAHARGGSDCLPVAGRGVACGCHCCHRRFTPLALTAAAGSIAHAERVFRNCPSQPFQTPSHLLFFWFCFGCVSLVHSLDCCRAPPDIGAIDPSRSLLATCPFSCSHPTGPRRPL